MTDLDWLKYQATQWGDWKIRNQDAGGLGYPQKSAGVSSIRGGGAGGKLTRKKGAITARASQSYSRRQPEIQIKRCKESERFDLALKKCLHEDEAELIRDIYYRKKSLIAIALEWRFFYTAKIKDEGGNPSFRSVPDGKKVERLRDKVLSGLYIPLKMN